MKVRAKNRLKRDGKHILAGSVLDVSNKEAKQLMDAGIVEPAVQEEERKPARKPNAPPPLPPPPGGEKKLEGEERQVAIDELVQVNFVTEEVAVALVDELDICGIDGLKKAKVAQLVGIKGVGEETAEKIIADAKEYE